MPITSCESVSIESLLLPTSSTAIATTTTKMVNFADSTIYSVGGDININNTNNTATNNRLRGFSIDLDCTYIDSGSCYQSMHPLSLMLLYFSLLSYSTILSIYV